MNETHVLRVKGQKGGDGGWAGALLTGMGRWGSGRSRGGADYREGEETQRQEDGAVPTTPDL